VITTRYHVVISPANESDIAPNSFSISTTSVNFLKAQALRSAGRDHGLRTPSKMRCIYDFIDTFGHVLVPNHQMGERLSWPVV
jgi:hypothetical protein